MLVEYLVTSVLFELNIILAIYIVSWVAGLFVYEEE